MEKNKLQSVIESILFVNAEAISVGKLTKITGVKNEDVLEALNSLEQTYAKEESGLSLLRHGEKIQLTTKADNSSFVEQLKTIELSETLSPATLEVLSIIAYRGPISKPEIESIRGVNCSYTVRNLLMRGLVERNDNPQDGRGYVYSITLDFLKKLGLESVKKLPQYDVLSKDERLQEVISEETKVEKEEQSQ